MPAKIRKRLHRLAARAYMHEPVRTLVRPWFAEPKPEKWAFIVGCYNSGTTILRYILGAHPDIRDLPREGVRFTSVLPRPEDYGWSRMWLKCSEQMRMPEGEHPELAKRIRCDWAPWFGRGGRVYLEKSIANILRLHWLEAHFPNAHFIGIVRNGYCVAEGIRRKAILRAPAIREYGNRYPIELAAAEWVRAVEILGEEGKRLHHYHQIQYEELVEKPVETLTAIWAFLGLDIPSMVLKNGALMVEGRKFALRNMNIDSLRRLELKDMKKATAVISKYQLQLGYEIT